MQGIVIHCPNHDCRKLLLKEANLPPTTSMKLKCYHCGHLIHVQADYKGIKLKDCSRNEKPGISFV